MEKPVKHIAGIIPVAGERSDFALEWHDSMMPIAPNYLAVERAVLECAYAGCSSIWIVCNDDISPILKYRIRDFISDPAYSRFKFSNYAFRLRNVKQQKLIPIFYVPVHAKYRGRVDSLGFSIIHGATYANNIASRVSEGTRPQMYYVAFPFGAYEPKFIKPLRKQMYAGNRVLATFDNKSVRDNEYLGFSFRFSDINSFIDKIKAGAKKSYRDDKGELIPLPKEKWYEAKEYTLDKIYGDYNPSDLVTRPIRWYHNIGSWDSYRKFLATEQCRYLKYERPVFLSARHYEQFSILNEEEEDGNV